MLTYFQSETQGSRSNELVFHDGGHDGCCSTSPVRVRVRVRVCLGLGCVYAVQRSSVEQENGNKSMQRLHLIGICGRDAVHQTDPGERGEEELCIVGLHHPASPIAMMNRRKRGQCWVMF